MCLNPPKHQILQSHQDGTAETRIATYQPQHLTVECEGYLKMRMGLPTVSSKRTIPDFYYPKGSGTPPRPTAEILLPMYREPEPGITLVVPDDYIGPIKILWVPAPRDDPRFTHGKRHFTYEVDSYGDIAIACPPLFRITPTNEISIRSQTRSGKTLDSPSYLSGPNHDSPNAIRLRQVDSQWTFDMTTGIAMAIPAASLYVVGTESDAAFFYRLVNDVTRDSYGGSHITRNPDGWQRIMQRARTLAPQ